MKYSERFKPFSLFCVSPSTFTVARKFVSFLFGVVIIQVDGDDPVYEEIRQTASDASDEELRRCVASRQSLRSCGDHSPLIPSAHVPADPSRHHGSHVHVVSDPHGFLYSPRSHALSIDR